jgi:hypothetical protein
MAHFIQNFLILSGVAFCLIAVIVAYFIAHEEVKQWRQKRMWDKYTKDSKGE